MLPGNYFALAESFKRSLRARGVSPKTLLTYSEAMQQLGEFLASSERPLQLRHITTDDVRDFEAALFTRGFKSSIVNNRHRSLQSFFKWLLAEDELDVNPMAKVKATMLESHGWADIPVCRGGRLHRTSHHRGPLRPRCHRRPGSSRSVERLRRSDRS